MSTYSGYDFEQQCANILLDNGFSNVEVTNKSGDQGVDVLATKLGVRYAIQCKFYSGSVGNKAVQEVYAGKTFYHCDRTMVMTNSSFTESARELAAATGTELWENIHCNSNFVGTVSDKKAYDFSTDSAQIYGDNTFKCYQYPPVSLLNEPSAVSNGTECLPFTENTLISTLRSFGVNAHFVAAVHSPVATRYELTLGRGVKLSSLIKDTEDLAFALGVPSIKIVPIPGRINMIAVEVPNETVTPVLLREVVDSQEFRTSVPGVSFAVGKDVSNRNVVGNLAELSHILISGATGSGKSIFLHSMLISLLYNASPADIRLILIDLKGAELNVYNGLPHLLIPVATGLKQANGALKWAEREVMRRHRVFFEHHVKNYGSYNNLLENAGNESEPETPTHMPRLVIFIDELADIMVENGKETEESICQIAQKGRAAGIHLIIATQSPFNNIVTNRMKASIPSRIALASSSAQESRAIINQDGAEQLLGNGDMLFAPLGIGKPMRVQGCLVTEEEVANVINFVKENSAANYDEEILAKVEEHARNAGKGGKGASAMNVTFPEPGGGDAPAESPAEEGGDELLPQAVDVVMETGMVSVSMLQRRLKLGYSRAARLVDQMEERGIVGPFEGAKPRKILITKEQWQSQSFQ